MEPLSREAAGGLLAQLRGWAMDADAVRIEKDFAFKDFASALAFVDRVGAIAEEEDHHPDIEFGWGKARIRLSTHSIGGLSENDFILAAKIDALGA